MAALDPHIEKVLREGHAALAEQGELLSERQISAACDLFEERFGPQKLRSLDGEALLELMHAHVLHAQRPRRGHVADVVGDSAARFV